MCLSSQKLSSRKMYLKTVLGKTKSMETRQDYDYDTQQPFCLSMSQGYLLLFNSNKKWVLFCIVYFIYVWQLFLIRLQNVHINLLETAFKKWAPKKKAQTSHPQLHPPQQREGLGTSVAHRISSASGTSARGLTGAVGCRASGLGRQGHPAWSWPRCTCMYSGPQTCALALTKFAFPLPNNRTPHLRCTKGPSNSTTSETEAVALTSCPTRGLTQLRMRSTCQGRLLASQVQPRPALPTAASGGPIALPQLLPLALTLLDQQGSQPWSAQRACTAEPAAQAGSCISLGSPPGAHTNSTRPHISRPRPGACCLPPHSTPSQAASLRGVAQAAEGLPPRAAHEKKLRSPR